MGPRKGWAPDLAGRRLRGFSSQRVGSDVRVSLTSTHRSGILCPEGQARARWKEALSLAASSGAKGKASATSGEASPDLAPVGKAKAPRKCFPSPVPTPQTGPGCVHTAPTNQLFGGVHTVAREEARRPARHSGVTPRLTAQGPGMHCFPDLIQIIFQIIPETSCGANLIRFLYFGNSLGLQYVQAHGDSP